MLLAVRHGPTVPVVGAVGQLDVALAVPAEDAAATIAAQLPAPPARLHSSPLSRCAATAQVLAASFGIPLTIDPRVLEIHLGDFEGQAWEAIPKDVFAAYAEAWETVGPPGGESAHDLTRRVAAWLDGLDRTQTHLLVAHAGVIRALHVLVFARAWPDAMALSVPHLALHRFPFDRHPRTSWPR